LAWTFSDPYAPANTVFWIEGISGIWVFAKSPKKVVVDRDSTQEAVTHKDKLPVENVISNTKNCHQIIGTDSITHL
jgi:hypothetical protein